MPHTRTLLLLVLSALISGTSAWAMADARIFEVRDVPVDATADGATEARAQAFAQGQGLAFDILLRRLTRKSDWGRLPPAEGQDFKRLISGFGVSAEKRSSTHYIAKVSYNFVPDRVRALLRGTGIPFSETRSKPVLVLPVLNTVDGKALLFEPENIWAAAWREKSLGQELVPMIVPDPSAQAIIPDFSPQAPSWVGVEPLARQQGAASVLVPEASLRRAGTQIVADIRLIKLMGDQSDQSTFSVAGGDEKDALSQAVSAIADMLTEDWKQATVTADSETSTLTADVQFDSLEQWLQVKRALADVPTVKDVRVIALSAEGAQIAIDYVGSSAQLAVSLAQFDLSLQAGTNGHYRLLSQAAPGAPDAPAPNASAPPALTAGPTTPPQAGPVEAPLAPAPVP